MRAGLEGLLNFAHVIKFVIIIVNLLFVRLIVGNITFEVKITTFTKIIFRGGVSGQAGIYPSNIFFASFFFLHPVLFYL